MAHCQGTGWDEVRDDFLYNDRILMHWHSGTLHLYRDIYNSIYDCMKHMNIAFCQALAQC